MKRLFIIGNGFDLCHHIKSKYSDFQNFAYKSNGYMASQMEIFYPNICNEEYMWGDVEKALGQIDPRKTYEECNSDFEIDYDHMMRSAAYLEDNPMILLEQILNDFHKCFEEWVQNIDISFVKINDTFNFTSEDLFFTFNYTDTLESVYDIEDKNINHIHGNRIKGEPLVIGFGSDCEHLFEKSVSDTTYEENSFQNICEIANREEKNTYEIIKYNYRYWDTLKGIDDVTVIGHSYSIVDLSYFKKIYQSISINAYWHLNYHSLTDKKNAEYLIKEIGIKSYELIKC